MPRKMTKQIRSTIFYVLSNSKFQRAVKIYVTDIVKLWRSGVEEGMIWTVRRNKITVAFIERLGI